MLRAHRQHARMRSCACGMHAGLLLQAPGKSFLERLVTILAQAWTKLAARPGRASAPTLCSRTSSVNNRIYRMQPHIACSTFDGSLRVQRLSRELGPSHVTDPSLMKIVADTRPEELPADSAFARFLS